MTRISTLVLLLAFFATPTQAQDPRSYEGITWRKVSEPGLEVQGGEATGVLDVPMDRVLTQVRDYASYEQFLPHFRQSRVLGERGDRAMIYLQVEILHGAGTLWAQAQVSVTQHGDDRVVEARMLRGNMDGFLARWKLEAVSDSRTKVTFTLVADPQVPAPSSVVANQNEQFARSCLRALRNRLR